jgi:hypothetical protein
MKAREVRLVLIRQTQTIRRALHLIELNLMYYERLVEEELREKASQAESEKKQASAQADQTGTERES